jgi:hypothetical protein
VITPPPFVILDDPNALARNRKTSNDWMLGEHGAATLNAVNTVNVIT